MDYYIHSCRTVGEVIGHPNSRIAWGFVLIVSVLSFRLPGGDSAAWQVTRKDFVRLDKDEAKRQRKSLHSSQAPLISIMDCPV